MDIKIIIIIICFILVLFIIYKTINYNCLYEQFVQPKDCTYGLPITYGKCSNYCHGAQEEVSFKKYPAKYGGKPCTWTGTYESDCVLYCKNCEKSSNDNIVNWDYCNTTCNNNGIQKRFVILDELQNGSNDCRVTPKIIQESCTGTLCLQENQDAILTMCKHFYNAL